MIDISRYEKLNFGQYDRRYTDRKRIFKSSEKLFRGGQ